MKKILTGLDRLREGYWKKLESYRLGLLANHASLDNTLRTAKEVISMVLPGQLKALFGPQHGYGGEEQDNMMETDHSYDYDLQIPIFSLYAERREPLSHMLETMDILIIDLQDVGTRVYTFAATVLNCLRAAAKYKKKVVVLDRPNPLGGEVVEGNILKQELYSFVGPYRFPMRHGLTMGEMAQIFNRVFKINCALEVIPMRGWNRDMLWHKTGLKWVMPSPNMPFIDTAYVYPGQVIWEGTNISEGRGTCRPFEIFGAPFLNTKTIVHKIDTKTLRGCQLQEYSFRPTFNKWKGELCHGFMIHVTNHRIFRPYLTSISLLRTIIDVHNLDFKWKKPPYEYEYDKRPIDLILGDSSLCFELESADSGSVRDMEAKWLPELESYVKWRKPYLLYN